MYSFIVLMALAAPTQSPTGQFDKYDLDNLPPVPPVAKVEAPKNAKPLPVSPPATYQTDEINRTRAWIKGQLQNKGRLNRTMDEIVNEADAKKLQRMATNLALYDYYYKPSYNTYWKPMCVPYFQVPAGMVIWPYQKRDYHHPYNTIVWK